MLGFSVKVENIRDVYVGYYVKGLGFGVRGISWVGVGRFNFFIFKESNIYLKDLLGEL